MKVKTGLGQDSHEFDSDSHKNLKLGGIEIPATPLKGNSDADVVLHSITNSISGVTGKNILGEISDEMCFDQGITESKEYLKEALKYLEEWEITHLSISIECLQPRMTPYIDKMKASLAKILEIGVDDIGITATTGEGLTSFGQGKGIQVLSIITVIKQE